MIISLTRIRNCAGPDSRRLRETSLAKLQMAVAAAICPPVKKILQQSKNSVSLHSQKDWVR
jgi:hypothetical protein